MAQPCPHPIAGSKVSRMTPHFFGYGSLVNLSTHDYPDARNATLRGWRREWRHTDVRPFAFLSARPVSGAEIDGVIAAVPNADWAALDEREAAYSRFDVSDAISAESKAAEIAVYQVDPFPRPKALAPILMSYLDVVIQGYMHRFGSVGVNAFFETTDGWDAPILHDRAAPIYPRHQVLSASDQDLVDRHMAQLPTVVKQLEQTRLTRERLLGWYSVLFGKNASGQHKRHASKHHAP